MFDISIREVTTADYSQLEDFLYHAIFIPEGEEYPPRGIIFQPEIYVYIKDFGLESDCGVIAEQGGKLIGAAWTRIIPAYGHLDDSTPELAISILPDYRGQGVGTLLMNRLFELLRERGYKRTSLSVQQNNPAVRFYERLGYRVTNEKLDHAGHEDYIMVKNLFSRSSEENSKLACVFDERRGVNRFNSRRLPRAIKPMPRPLGRGSSLFQDIKPRMTEPKVGEIISYAAIDGSAKGVAKEIEKYLSSDNLHFYGWVEENKIFGICGFEVHDNKVEIHLISVAEEKQRQGIGSAMVTALKEMYSLPLEAETVDEAVGFYHNYGFEIAEFQDPTWGTKYTCVLGKGKANIKIREAKSEDIWQLLELYAELQPHDPPIDMDTAINVFKQSANCGVTYFVADNDGKIVGSCYIAIIPNITKQCSPIGFIENVVTASAYRRHGIGRKLMNRAIEHAKEQGCYKVTLQSGTKRTEAHKFYESVGFDGGSKRAFEIRF